MAGFFFLQFTGLLNLLVPGRFSDTEPGYGMLFVTGLLTSVHCIAMCGGINLTQSLPDRASAAAGSADSSKASPFFLSSFLYNLGRVCSYTAFGAVLGTAGLLFGGNGTAVFPVSLQGFLKMLASIVMILAGVNMTGLFPVFRKFRLPVPDLFRKLSGTVLKSSRRPFLIGVLNGFMPCGPLQLMWVIALASGSPVSGALSMFFFSLGTVPLMLGLGSAVSMLGKKYTGSVLTAGSVLVIILGLAMFTQGSMLSGLFSRSSEPAVQEVSADENAGSFCG